MTQSDTDPGTTRPGEDGYLMLANRLRKNLRNIGKWARQQNIQCYRLYDNDLPEYAFAIDVYGDKVCMAEYQAPAQIAAAKVQERQKQALAAVADVLQIAPEQIYLKTRQRQRGKSQYEVQDQSREFFVVREGAAKLWVNLRDYLDTGLFLDHRPIRRYIFENCRDQRFLNLFCYTGSATVHAALGGAKSTLSIDLSNTYLDWARKNFGLNGLGGSQHRLKREDCIEYLESNTAMFDMIFLDPPTFSNSKSSEFVLDIQRDHQALIKNAMKKLESGGLLIFSTNLRNFKLDDGIGAKFAVKDFTRQSIDKDFERNKRIHQTWLIRHR